MNTVERWIVQGRGLTPWGAGTGRTVADLDAVWSCSRALERTLLEVCSSEAWMTGGSRPEGEKIEKQLPGTTPRPRCVCVEGDESRVRV